MKTKLLRLAFLLVTTSQLCAQQQPVESFHGISHSRTMGLLSKIQEQKTPPENLSRARLSQTPFYGSRVQANANEPQRRASDADYGFNSSDYQGLNIPMKSVADASGNVYTTGISADAENPKGNFVTIKTDAAGTIAWSTRKPVVDFAVEYGTAIAIDASGNPIAVGMHWNGTNMDAHVEKLDAATGTVIWQSNYEGIGNGIDIPMAVTVDASGNIIVAGITFATTSIRYMVLKYDADGALQWSFADTNLVDNVWNEPSAVAVDALGNIAVTGFGSTSDYYQTYYTIKLDANGNKLWGRDYAFQVPSDPGDPDSEPVNANAVASDVKFDTEGNCYVTGTLDTGAGTMGTLKYDLDGNQSWLSVHKSGIDHTSAHQLEITSDAIYVSGRHMGDWIEDGLVLISYDFDGTENWISETTNLADTKVPYLLLDDSGRPVISGYGYDDNNNMLCSTLRYQPDGTIVTETNFLIEAVPTESLNGLVGLSLDQSGNLTFSLAYTYTALGNVFRTTKIPFAAGDQQPIWNANFSGTSRNNKRLLSSVAGQDGNVFIAGSFGQIEGESYIVNYYLEKYAADGSVAWQKAFNPANGNDVNGIQLQVAPDGNAIVYLMPYGFGDPVRLKKYDGGGNLLWEYEKTVATPGFGTFFLDGSGNSYLSGASRIAETDEQPVFTTIKVSASGLEQWTTHTPSANAADNIYEINSGTSDADGNIIVSGAVGSGSFFSQNVDAALLKYDPDGVLQWFSATPASGNNSAFASIFTQADGSIIANGALSSPDTGQEKMLLRKYDGAGIQQWEAVVEQDGRNVRSYKTVSLDNGELVTAAFSVIYGVENKILVTRFDAQGNQLSMSETALAHFYRDITTDGQEVYLLSQYYDTTMPHRLFNSSGSFYAGKVSKVTPGEMLDESLVGPELSPFDPGNFVIDGQRLLIPGTLESEAAVFQGVYFFASDFEMLGTDDPVTSSPEADWLGQNYPNPAKGTVSIPIDLPYASNVDVTLYDTTGRRIGQVHNGNLPQGPSEISYSVAGLASGIYFYQARTASGKKASRKLVVE
ncbi:T9SS type A sorting domain-containing protein [Flavobacterium selenitireducens]|uniref:T9SS type A sorting domain-containing protein n=1 Tax=Flavobacterium selenitireducens TaxID=2722704 RepID=UPI00168BB7FD|nr:T9SS type A sorting domain-containing protein [Flavobacterium selenitireducens]MBD3581273.1 T9SS type A sorting domain-containing protein [Flavobacterium selenitireducens]